MSGSAPLRLLILADSELGTSVKLLRGALCHTGDREDVEVTAVVDAAHSQPGRLRPARTAAAELARRAFDPPRAAGAWDRPPPLAGPALLARRYRLPLLAPGEKTVNDPAFVNSLAESGVRADAALVLMVGQVFEEELLDACGEVVNYHDGFLPAYRGVGATSWSLYNGEARSGFAYNRLVPGLDRGPVLVEGAVEVSGQAVGARVEREKTALGIRSLPRALDLLRRSEPGRPQEGEARMYTRRDLSEVSVVGDPATITWDELNRRLRAFEQVELNIGGRTLPVTAVRPARHWRPGPRFLTADGVHGVVTRVSHVAPWAHLLGGRLR